MGPIQSIIVYNGGSAGDFLKSVCVEQLHRGSVHTLTDKGMTEFSNHHFKYLTDRWYREQFQQPLDIDNNKVYQVENTHYYNECYHQITHNVFYIDYPDESQPLITELYIKKRWLNDYQKVLDNHKKSLPEHLQKFVKIQNIVPVLNTLWIKNLKTWRSCPGLKKIDICQLLSYDSLVPIVEDIIQQPLLDAVQLKTTHQKWIDMNQDLVNFFCMPKDII